jgi:hypothetical protein
MSRDGASIHRNHFAWTDGFVLVPGDHTPYNRDHNIDWDAPIGKYVDREVAEWQRRGDMPAKDDDQSRQCPAFAGTGVEIWHNDTHRGNSVAPIDPFK